MLKEHNYTKYKGNRKMQLFPVFRIKKTCKHFCQIGYLSVRNVFYKFCVLIIMKPYFFLLFYILNVFLIRTFWLNLFYYFLVGDLNVMKFGNDFSLWYWSPGDWLLSEPVNKNSQNEGSGTMPVPIIDKVAGTLLSDPISTAREDNVDYAPKIITKIAAVLLSDPISSPDSSPTSSSDSLPDSDSKTLELELEASGTSQTASNPRPLEISPFFMQKVISSTRSEEFGLHVANDSSTSSDTARANDSLFLKAMIEQASENSEMESENDASSKSDTASENDSLDKSDTENENDVRSNEPEGLPQAVDVIEDFYNLVMSTRSRRELTSETINAVRQMIPQNMFTADVDVFNDDNNAIIIYSEQFLAKSPYVESHEKMTEAFYVAALQTYNYMTAHNLEKITDDIADIYCAIALKNYNDREVDHFLQGLDLKDMEDALQVIEKNNPKK